MNPRVSSNPREFTEADAMWLGFAQEQTVYSYDNSRKVGAVAQLANGEWTRGHNTTPRSIKDSDNPNYYRREVKDFYIMHAEEVALTWRGHDYYQSYLYVTQFPCAKCARLIAQVGVSRLVSPARPWRDGTAHNDKYQDSWDAAEDILDQSGIIRVVGSIYYPESD